MLQQKWFTPIYIYIRMYNKILCIRIIRGSYNYIKYKHYNNLTSIYTKSLRSTFWRERDSLTLPLLKIKLSWVFVLPNIGSTDWRNTDVQRTTYLAHSLLTLNSIPFVYKVFKVEYLTCIIALELLPSLLLCLTLHATATMLSLWKCTHRYKFMHSYRILSNVPCLSSLYSYLPDQSSQGTHHFM